MQLTKICNLNKYMSYLINNLLITIFDLAGNKGDVISVSTSDNNSKVIYDRTVPSDFTLGTVMALGGNTIEDAWNLTNTGLEIIVPIENDTTLKNGWVQARAKIGQAAAEKGRYSQAGRRR